MLYTLFLLLITHAPSLVEADVPACPNPSSSGSFDKAYFPQQDWKYHCHGQTDIYAIRQSPGKGLGVFARRDLEVGTVIMRETPVLKILPPDYVKGSGYPMNAVSQLLRADFIHLSAEEQEEVMSLAYYSTAADKNTSDTLGLIFKTNAYKSGEEIGLFPKIARINHSCRPNTSYFWHAKSNRRVMYANRKIKKGEEILDSYISLLLPQEERQKHLRPYGFTCTCEACAAQRKAKQESDKRRMTIKKGFSDFGPHLTLDTPKGKRDKRQAAKNAKASAQLAELVQQEGLADYYATAYRIAAISHARAEDWQAATIWANRGYEWRVMEDPESSYAMEMHELTAKFIESWKDELRSKNMLTRDV